MERLRSRARRRLALTGKRRAAGAWEVAGVPTPR